MFFCCKKSKKLLTKPRVSKFQVYILLPYKNILMKKNIWITTKIKHFSKIFKDKRTYEIFKTIISWILCLKNWKQWDLANIWWKTLAQIQYFFYKSNWSSKLLNQFRVSWIRNKISWCADKISDIVIFDWSIMTKNIKSNFSGFANWFFSNKDKKVVNWLEIFWASIITKTKIRYMLKKANVMYLEKWRMWVFKDVYLKSWIKKKKNTGL